MNLNGVVRSRLLELLSPVEGADAPMIVAAHKRLMADVIVPTLGAASVLFLVLNWSPTWRFAAVTLIGLFVCVINAYVTARPRTFSLLGLRLRSHTNEFDLVRWCLNIVWDAAAMLVLQPKGPIMVQAWLSIFLVAAYLDTYRPSYRLVIIALAFATFGPTMAVLFPEQPLELTWGLSVCAALLVIVGALERSLVREMVEIGQRRDAESDLKELSRRLQVDATLGTYSRIIVHELHNVATILDHGGASIHDAAGGDEASRAIARAVEHIRRLSDAVLTPTRTQPEMRLATLGSVFSDLDVMVRKFVQRRLVAWRIEAHGLEGETFREREGGVYLLVLNLVKNAVEAFGPPTQTPKDAAIRVEACSRGEDIVIMVVDNGPGLTATQLEELRAGGVTSLKRGGNGVGLKFVVLECASQGFRFEVSSETGRGTRAAIVVPRAREACA